MTDIQRIHALSFKDLKKELINCGNNPVRELMIREIMHKKYCEYTKNKSKKPLIHQKQPKRTRQQEKEEEEEQEEQEEQQIYLEDEDFDELPKMESLNELDDDRFKTEVKKDHLNNNLMDRLNSDIDICSKRKDQLKKKKEQEKSFIPPFADDIGDRYAPFITAKNRA